MQSRSLRLACPDSSRPRRLVPELMDDPALDPVAHRAALAGLRRINKLSHAAGPLWGAIRPLLVADRPLRVLDLATGGGDVVLALHERARALGRWIEFTALDVSPVAVAEARARAAKAGASVEFRAADVLAAPLPAGHDVVMSSLFFHHLHQTKAVELLSRMGAAAPVVLVEDLRRSALGTALAAGVPRFLTRSPVVHVDALRSARAAFTASEMRVLARAAGLTGARVRCHWPSRLLLDWRRSP